MRGMYGRKLWCVMEQARRAGWKSNHFFSLETFTHTLQLLMAKGLFEGPEDYGL